MGSSTQEKLPYKCQHKQGQCLYIYVFLLVLGNFMSTLKKHWLTADLIIQKLCQSQLDEQKKDEEAQMRRRVSHSSTMVHICLL